MATKKITAIILMMIVVLVIIAGLLFYNSSPKYDKCDINKDGKVDAREQKRCATQENENKCGNGICEKKETSTSCPQDCETSTTTKTCSEQNGKICSSNEDCEGSWISSSDSSRCCNGECIDSVEPPPTGSESELSPFGFHPATPYSDANYIGIKWTRGGDAPYIFWSFVDPEMTGNPDDFQWSGTTAKGGSFNYDLLTNSQDYGINLLHNIDVQPSREGYRKQGSFMPIDEQAYKNFVKEVVKRYPHVRYWQISNEPSTGLSDFGEFTCLSYDAIKEADPEVKVLIGGAPGMNMPQTFSSYKTTFDSTFLPLLQEIDEENRRCFDVFDYHWYGDDNDYLINKDIHNYIVGKINSLGIPEPEEYWITEMGTYSGDPIAKTDEDKVGNEWPYQTEKQQAVDLVKRNVYPLSLGVTKIFMAFGLIEGFTNTDGYFDLTGLIYNGIGNDDQGNGVKKLGYYTYKKMTETLEGSDWSNIENIQESDGVYVYKFENNGKNIWVAWNDNSESKQITISGITSSQVKITDAVPNKELGKDIDYENDFNIETKSTSSNSVSIALGDVPVFIEEN